MKFLDVKDYQPSDKKNFMTMLRLLKRFELYMNAKTPNEFKLDFENFNVDVVRELEYFVRNEYLFINKPIFKLIYEELPEKRRPTLRGSNTVFKIMKRFRTFIKWTIKEQLLQNDPFFGCPRLCRREPTHLLEYAGKGKILGVKPKGFFIELSNVSFSTDCSKLPMAFL
jgi:hypothetical protein